MSNKSYLVKDLRIVGKVIHSPSIKARGGKRPKFALSDWFASVGNSTWNIRTTDKIKTKLAYSPYVQLLHFKDLVTIACQDEKGLHDVFSGANIEMFDVNNPELFDIRESNSTIPFLTETLSGYILDKESRHNGVDYFSYWSEHKDEIDHREINLERLKLLKSRLAEEGSDIVITSKTKRKERPYLNHH